MSYCAKKQLEMARPFVFCGTKKKRCTTCGRVLDWPSSFIGRRGTAVAACASCTGLMSKSNRKRRNNHVALDLFTWEPCAVIDIAIRTKKPVIVVDARGRERCMIVVRSPSVTR